MNMPKPFKLSSVLVAIALIGGSIGAAWAVSETYPDWFQSSERHPVLGLQIEGATAEPEFTCELSAVVSIANTTGEIVALTAGKKVYVCGFLLGNATAGTFKFIDGTGTACATSPSDMSGALSLADKATVPMPPGRGTLFRTRSARALCGTAGTGTVTGVLAYTVR